MKQRQELRECFNLIDTDGSGSISQAEITEALNYMGVKVSAQSLAKIMKDVDTDGSGELEWSEFSQVWLRVAQLRSRRSAPRALHSAALGSSPLKRRLRRAKRALGQS